MLAELLEPRKKETATPFRGLGYCLVIAALALYASPVVGAILRAFTAENARAEGFATEAAARAAALVSGRPALFYLLFAFALGSAGMLAWTVFFELALGRKKMIADKTDTVSWGSYGTCRHPGFWWLALYMLSLASLRGFSPSVVPAFLVIFFNFLLIEVQDRYSFPRIFKDYKAYREKVPFLIPRCMKRETRHR